MVQPLVHCVHCVEHISSPDICAVLYISLDPASDMTYSQPPHYSISLNCTAKRPGLESFQAQLLRASASYVLLRGVQSWLLLIPAGGEALLTNLCVLQCLVYSNIQQIGTK